jgi:hypothetical protein
VLCCWKTCQKGSMALPAAIITFSLPGCSGTNVVMS